MQFAVLVYEKPGSYETLSDAELEQMIRRAVWRKEKLSSAEVHCIMNLCMAATYDPDPRAPNGFCVPFNLETGELIRANSPFGVWMTKEVMWDNLEATSLQAAIDLENRTQILTTFTEDMRGAYDALTGEHSDVLAITDPGRHYDYPSLVKAEIERDDRQSYLKAAWFANDHGAEVVNIQHEYGLFGGTRGDYLLSAGLRSDFYIDKLLLFSSPQLLRLIARLFVPIIAEIKPGNPTDNMRLASRFFRDKGVQSRPTHGFRGISRGWRFRSRSSPDSICHATPARDEATHLTAAPASSAGGAPTTPA